MAAGASSTTAEDLRLAYADLRLPVCLSSRLEPVTSASLMMPALGSMAGQYMYIHAIQRKDEDSIPWYGVQLLGELKIRKKTSEVGAGCLAAEGIGWNQARSLPAVPAHTKISTGSRLSLVALSCSRGSLPFPLVAPSSSLTTPKSSVEEVYRKLTEPRDFRLRHLTSFMGWMNSKSTLKLYRFSIPSTRRKEGSFPWHRAKRTLCRWWERLSAKS